MDNELTPEFREIIETLAISEEFTLFCLFVIDGWPDGAEVIFRLAQRLQGWGRIHVHFILFLLPLIAQRENIIVNAHHHMGCVRIT